jgi:hypothetical protein
VCCRAFDLIWREIRSALGDQQRSVEDPDSWRVTTAEAYPFSSAARGQLEPMPLGLRGIRRVAEDGLISGWIHKKLPAGAEAQPLFCGVCGTTKSLSANCSAGLQTGCTGGFQAARGGGCRSGDLHDSRSGERRYQDPRVPHLSPFGKMGFGKPGHRTTAIDLHWRFQSRV